MPATDQVELDQELDQDTDTGTDQELEQEQTAEATVDDTPVAEASESADATSGGGAVDADATSGVDEGLAGLARSYGLDPANFKDTESLGAAVAHFDRQAAEFGRQLMQRIAPQGEQPTKQDSQQQQAAQAAALNLDELLPEAEFDPKLRNAVKALQDFWQKQNAELAASAEKKLAEKFGVLDQFVQRQAQEEQARYSRDLDAYFAKLGNEWDGVFGRGAVNSLSPFSPQLKARNELIQEAMAMRMADAELGRPQQSLEQLLDRARSAKFSQQQDTIARKQVAAQLNKRGQAAASRPAAKNGKPSPLKAVQKFVQDWDRKHLGAE